MKFRDLKKKEYVIYFDSFQWDNTDIYECFLIGKTLHFWTDFDSEYQANYQTSVEVTYKDIKNNLSNWKDIYYYTNIRKPEIRFYDGKCSKCGKEINIFTWANSGMCWKCEHITMSEAFGEKPMLHLFDDEGNFID